MTQYYIGAKHVVGYPTERDGRPGYTVRYIDGYEPWSPKETFEEAYLPMGSKDGFDSNQDTITLEMVEDFIVRYEDVKMGEKNTVVMAVLRNGFTIVESSACVDPANYNHELGVQIAKKRIQDQVWKLLGFLLQTARYGVNNH